MIQAGLVILLLLLAQPAAAKVLAGEVVGITDGDTITVLDRDKKQYKVRLATIDTPERRQAYYQRARQALSQLVHRKQVEIHWKKRDRYGRIIGKVMVADPACAKSCPKDLDAGLRLIEQGYAWWYRYFSREQPKAERERYEAAEAKARKAGIGLWADEDPTPPWDFRRKKRSKKR